jgi:hypothetical protein
VPLRLSFLKFERRTAGWGQDACTLHRRLAGDTRDRQDFGCRDCIGGEKLAQSEFWDQICSESLSKGNAAGAVSKWNRRLDVREK